MGSWLNSGLFCVIIYMGECYLLAMPLDHVIVDEISIVTGRKRLTLQIRLRPGNRTTVSWPNRSMPSVRPKGRPAELTAFLLRREIIPQRREELATDGRTCRPFVDVTLDADPMGEGQAKFYGNPRHKT
jgi:hypothetical protein